MENPESTVPPPEGGTTVLVVEVLAGADAGARLTFSVPGSVVLGRRGTPDLALRRLSDPGLAERHALVTVGPGEQIRLDHLGPVGGTRVGGRPVRSVALSSGALVELGPTTLRMGIEHADRMGGRVRRARLSEFEILEEVGEGAFSRVYDARDRQTGARVALKRLVLAGEEDRETRISAFLREIETVAALDHPGIVGIRAAGRKGDEVFLVLDFLEGPDLEAQVAIGGPLPPSAVRRVGIGTLDALAYAHARGVLHRDVKPSNVMLLPEEAMWRPVLVDFGLAIRPTLETTWGLTRTGELRGTPGFLAPECRFDARGHSVRADLYGVGATLYFALTGQVPESREAADALPDLDFDLPEEVWRAVEKALSPDPRRRWNSAVAMRGALARA